MKILQTVNGVQQHHKNIPIDAALSFIGNICCEF